MTDARARAGRIFEMYMARDGMTVEAFLVYALE